MVDFQSSRKLNKPRNYLARREQRRLLLLVLSLGLVAILTLEMSDADNWQWFVALTSTAKEAPPPASEQIDNRLLPKSSGDDTPGTFLSPANVDQQAEEDTTGRYFPGVKPGYFKAIRDDTHFRSDETSAWFNLLEILENTDQAALEKASAGRVTYAQLFKQSKEYRGELVTVRGTVRRAELWHAPPNEIGLKEYFRLCLFPDDNPASPLIIYCLYLPEGFPAGREVVAEAEVIGFFFKRWAYLAGDPQRPERALRTAPTLVARTLRWEKPPPQKKVEEEPFSLGGLLLVTAVALAASVMIAVYVYRLTRLTPVDVPEKLPEFHRLRDADVPIDAGPPLENPLDSGPDS